MPAFAPVTSFSSSCLSGLWRCRREPLLGVCARPRSGPGRVSAVVLRRPSCVPAGLLSAAGVPRPDAGAGALSEGHGAGAPQTPVPEAGGAAVLHRSSHEAVPASLSARVTEVKASRGCETCSGERKGTRGPRPAD